MPNEYRITNIRTFEQPNDEHPNIPMTNVTEGSSFMCRLLGCFALLFENPATDGMQRIQTAVISKASLIRTFYN